MIRTGSGIIVPSSIARPIGRIIGGFGDSFTANGHAIAATAYATENYGYAFWAAAGSNAYAPYTEMFGVGGTTTADFITAARLNPVLSGQSSVIMFPSVTNDFTLSGMTLDATKRNVLKIIEKITGAGKIIIVGTCTPRYADKAITDPARLADMIAYKDWVLNYLSKFVPVVDLWTGWTQADTVDNLHPNPQGAQKIGGKFANIIRSLPMQPPALPVSAADLYSATLNPFGSLTPNPLLQNTATNAIGASANPVAGSILADGHTVAGSNMTGLTTKWSLEAGAFGNKQVIEINGTMTTAGGYFAMTSTAGVTLANLAVGDVIESLAAWEVSGPAASLLSWGLELIVTKPVSGTSTNIYYRSGDKYQEPYTLPANCRGNHETMRYTFDGTETKITHRMSCYPSQNIVQTGTKVKVAQLACRKV